MDVDIFAQELTAVLYSSNVKRDSLAIHELRVPSGSQLGIRMMINSSVGWCLLVKHGDVVGFGNAIRASRSLS